MYVLTCQSKVQRFALPILIGLAAVGALLLFIVPPIAQPQWYHDFADQRLLLGIPNFWNVISNLPFLIVGGWGIWYVMASRSAHGVPDSTERWIYLFFFFTVALTGIGSAYYHLEPNNDRFVWDRLPLAMMFMALFAIIIAERLSRRTGILLFVPLAIMGAASLVLAFYRDMGQGISAALSVDANLSGFRHTYYSVVLSGNLHKDRETL
jgi:ceramidase